jgi:hypothetical protein
METDQKKKFLLGEKNLFFSFQEEGWDPKIAFYFFFATPRNNLFCFEAKKK